MLERKTLATRLLAEGVSRAEVKAELCSEHGLTAAQAETTIRSVEIEIENEHQVYLPRARAMAIHRLEGLTLKALSERTPNLNALIRIEALRARIEGTFAPTRVEMKAQTIPESLATYLGTLTDDECNRILEEERTRVH